MTTANEKLAFIKSLKQINVTSFQVGFVINGNLAESWFNVAMAARLKDQITGENAPVLIAFERTITASAKDELRDAIAAKKAELDALKAQFDNLSLGNP